ncbi:MAG: cell division protein FtsA [Deltaproteobacteria bacterium]|jgi:cell division protein FtsA|nr:cell division protein FtsA [Deltaproteobacteria bacterium]
MSNNDEVLVAIDIGTTKICCLVAERADDDDLNIKAIGSAASVGLSRGRVINMPLTVKAIAQAVDQASERSGYDCRSAYIGIAGDHISGIKVHGSVSTRNGIVTEDDIDRAMKSAMIMRIPSHDQILDRVALEYRLDGLAGIANPIGMRGTKLEVFVHVFTVDSNSLDDLCQCVYDAGLAIDEVYLESVASAEAVLTPAEKEMGVMLLDIGGGTCGMSVYVKGAIHHVFEVPLGGDVLTHDLATGLNISLYSAELLKMSHGCCHEDLIPDDYDIDVPSLDGLSSVTVGVSNVCHILRKRIESLYGHVSNNLIQSGYDDDVSNVVLTGGTSLLAGMQELGLDYFNRQIRLGSPYLRGTLSDLVESPVYSTAVGLMLRGMRVRESQLGGRVSGGFWVFDKVKALFGR